MASVADLIALSGDRYSPNLRKWLARNQRPFGTPHVFHDNDGHRWVGWIDDDWFIGARLWRVLTVGTKAEVGCWTFPVSDLTEEPDFWDRYAAIGRCAIDENHERCFIGEETRWREDGDERECLWCGQHRQFRHRWTDRVERERWAA